jgi:hypothetical protein
MFDFKRNEPSFEEILKDVYKHRFNFDSPLPERPEYLLEIEQEEHRYGIALEGSVIEFSGMPKARKSTLMAGFVAASLSKSKKALNICSKIDNTIVWIDTEQSELEFKYFQRMVVKMAGLNHQPENYIALNIRKYDDSTRFKIVDRVINGIKDLGMVVLDGIADLSFDENEQNSTKALVSHVMSWADYRSCPLLAAIHTNKDGKSSTGHLGGYLDKRCSYHIRVEKKSDNDPSLVTPRLSRMGETFRPFKFAHQIGNLPAIYTESFIGDEDGAEPEGLPF